MADKVDKGEVTRTVDEGSYGDTNSGWSKNVTYTDEVGNSMSINRGGYERGSSEGVYNDVSARCANGAVIPKDKLGKINEDLKSGFWFPDTLTGLFPVRDHDFGNDNPLNKACTVAKPTGRGK